MSYIKILENMKVEKYKIGTGGKKIYISANIFTTDGALVTADVNLLINNKKYIKAESKNGEAFIEKSLIDTDKDLANGLIVIEADIDLKLIDNDYWQEIFNDLAIEYLFDGGDKNEIFKLEIEDIKYKSSSGRIIVTKKYFVFKS